MSTYNAKEWLASPWTPDGKTIYALVHNEYQGRRYLSGCTLPVRVLVQLDHERRLDELGRDLHQHLAPAHLVATIPYQFTKDGPNGYFTPSNIVRSGDGYFYAMFRANRKGAQQLGTCLMRTRDLSDPTSWRAWNGTSFTVQFVNPYIADRSTRPTTSARRSTSTASGLITESLTYNTYFKKWMLVGNSVGDPAHNKPPGRLLLALRRPAQLDQRGAADGGRDHLGQGLRAAGPDQGVSILDPSSTSRNFRPSDRRRSSSTPGTT